MNYNTSRAEYNPEKETYYVGEFVFELRSLYAYLEEVNDLRNPKGVRYRLADVLTLILLAKMSGEDEVKGMAQWLKHRCEGLVEMLGLPRQIMPHETTLSRILGLGIDEDALERTLQRYFDGRVQASGDEVITMFIVDPFVKTTKCEYRESFNRHKKISVTTTVTEIVGMYVRLEHSGDLYPKEGQALNISTIHHRNLSKIDLGRCRII